ncbi:uncharacterized protein LOC144560968 [Carex rostrata]
MLVWIFASIQDLLGGMQEEQGIGYWLEQSQMPTKKLIPRTVLRIHLPGKWAHTGEKSTGGQNVLEPHTKQFMGVRVLSNEEHGDLIRNYARLFPKCRLSKMAYKEHELHDIRIQWYKFFLGIIISLIVVQVLGGGWI